MPYRPLKITGMKTGLVESREEFLLPEDGFPELENAYIWRERIRRRRGFDLLGRLKRDLDAAASVNNITVSSGTDTFNVFTVLDLASNEPNADIVPGDVSSIVIDINSGAYILTDSTGDGNFVITGSSAGDITSASINYATGVVTIVSIGFGPFGSTVTMEYHPRLPVMGLRLREADAINLEDLIAFDTTYAYRYNPSTEEFNEWITGTTWSGSDSDFFWSTNYWRDGDGDKLFWATNFNTADPIRYSDGSAWSAPFNPTLDGSGNELRQARVLLPYRERLVALNIYEDDGQGNYTHYPQRIRWAQIGNPIASNAWRQDIPGNGGYVELPTTQHIVSAAFVRDNMVVFCERSTWLLRYTGQRTIPFVPELINNDLGAESTFSTVAFDKHVIGVGDKSINVCDGFTSEPIDVKIPDFAFEIENQQSGPERVHGLRDFFNRVAYWTYPSEDEDRTYPNRMLVYNYENQSWAKFTDSFTCLGTAPRAADITIADMAGQSWGSLQIPWGGGVSQARFPLIVAGNQQGFVMTLWQDNLNAESLAIQSISGAAARITSPAHNLDDGQIIRIDGCLGSTTYNDQLFRVEYHDADNLNLESWDTVTETWQPAVIASGTYIGGGKIYTRPNFRVLTKKFSRMEQGEKIQVGYLDILAKRTAAGAFGVFVYTDYYEGQEANDNGDPFFNTVFSTAQSSSVGQKDKVFKRVTCPVNGDFVQVAFGFTDAQMAAGQDQNTVEIDALIVYERGSGRLTR